MVRLLNGGLLSLVLLLTMSSAAFALPLEPIVFPTNTLKISSPFGGRIHPLKRVRHLHSGIDIPSPFGSKVRAIQSGTIAFASNYGGYGELVTISHDQNVTSLYGHLSKIDVSVGDVVTAGQVIGEVGESGQTTGPHLHFEIRVGGVPIDPERVWGD